MATSVSLRPAPAVEAPAWGAPAARWAGIGGTFVGVRASLCGSGEPWGLGCESPRATTELGGAAGRGVLEPLRVLLSKLSTAWEGHEAG